MHLQFNIFKGTVIFNCGDLTKSNEDKYYKLNIAHKSNTGNK